MSGESLARDKSGRQEMLLAAGESLRAALRILEAAAAEAPSAPTTDTDPWLTPAQIAERWSCSQAFVRSEMRCKALRSMRAGTLLRSRLSWVASYERKRSED